MKNIAGYLFGVLMLGVLLSNWGGTRDFLFDTLQSIMFTPSQVTCKQAAKEAENTIITYQGTWMRLIGKVSEVKEISRTSSELVCEGEALFKFSQIPRKTIRLIYYVHEGYWYLKTTPVDPCVECSHMP